MTGPRSRFAVRGTGFRRAPGRVFRALSARSEASEASKASSPKPGAERSRVRRLCPIRGNNK